MEFDNIYLKELNERGKTLFSCDKYQEAIDIYQKAIDENPMYLDTYFNMCEALIMSDRFDEAKKTMKKVLLVKKDSGLAYFHLGNIALLEEDYEAGQLYYAKAINNGFDDPQLYMNLASVSEEDDDYEKAIEYYTKAIARDKLFYPAKIRRIQIYMAINKTSEAINACDDLIETNPEIFEGHHLKFVSLATSKQYDAAEQVLDKAMKMFPDDQGFVLDKVKLLELTEKPEEALSLLETINTEIVPKDVIAIEKSNLYFMLGRTAEAKELLEQCSSENDATELLHALLMVYIDSKDYEAIVKTANRIITKKEYDSNYFTSLYYRAYALKMMGKKEEAEKAYSETAKIMQQACSINSGVLDLYIYRAICYAELKEKEKANEMIEYVETVDERIAETHYIRYMLLKEEEPEKAENELAIAKSLNPDISALFEN